MTANQYTSNHDKDEACLLDWERKTNELARLYKPLIDHLIKDNFRLDLIGMPKINRAINLDVRDWPDQYKANINRCMGFDIKWRKQHAPIN